MEIDSGPAYISKTFIAFANFGKFISLMAFLQPSAQAIISAPIYYSKIKYINKEM